MTAVAEVRASIEVVIGLSAGNTPYHMIVELEDPGAGGNIWDIGIQTTTIDQGADGIGIALFGTGGANPRLRIYLETGVDITQQDLIDVVDSSLSFRAAIEPGVTISDANILSRTPDQMLPNGTTDLSGERIDDLAGGVTGVDGVDEVVGAVLEFDGSSLPGHSTCTPSTPWLRSRPRSRNRPATSLTRTPGPPTTTTSRTTTWS